MKICGDFTAWCFECDCINLILALILGISICFSVCRILISLNGKSSKSGSLTGRFLKISEEVLFRLEILKIMGKTNAQHPLMKTSRTHVEQMGIDRI